MGMSIFEAIALFLIGCIVGFLAGLILWAKDLSLQIAQFEIELAKIKAELEVEDGNVD